MEITIARHGQTEWNIARLMQGHMDSYLSPLGNQQAHLIGERFSKEQQNSDFDLILCSDLGRTRLTLYNILASTGEEKLNRLKNKKIKILFCKYVREGAGGVFETKPMDGIDEFLYF